MECTELQLETSLYHIFIKPWLPERNTPHFMVTPDLCHHLLAVHTFVNNCSEG